MVRGGRTTHLLGVDPGGRCGSLNTNNRPVGRRSNDPRTVRQPEGLGLVGGWPGIPLGSAKPNGRARNVARLPSPAPVHAHLCLTCAGGGIPTACGMAAGTALALLGTALIVTLCLRWQSPTVHAAARLVVRPTGWRQTLGERRLWPGCTSATVWSQSPVVPPKFK